MSLNELQEIVLAGDKVAGQNFVIEKVLPDIISDEIYGTLAFATNTRKELEKYSVLNPNELLIEGVEETIERDWEFFQIAGLALKNGASSNLYVTVPTDQGLSVLHIIVYAYKLFLERGEDYASLVAIVCLLCSAGSDVRLPVTDRDILLQRMRERETVSLAEVIDRVGPTKSVMGWLSEQPRTPLAKVNDWEPTVYLEDLLLKHIAVYTVFRKSLADVKNAIQEPIFTSDSLGMVVQMTKKDYASVSALSKEIGEVLDEPSHIGIIESASKLSSLLNVHANRCAKSILEGRKISEEPFTALEMEEAFLEAVDAYNPEGANMIMDYGFVPKYNHVDRIMFLAATKYFEELYLSSEILNGILVSMAKRGICFDREQLIFLSTFSEKTYQEINEIEGIPYWKRLCSAIGDWVRSDVKALARELDLDPEMSRAQLCEEFGKINLLTEEGGALVFKRLRWDKKVSRLRTMGGDTEDIILNDKSDPFSCVNYEHLTRDALTYAEIDLHHVVERDGQIYCFETIDYPKLIETGVNPYTGNPISTFQLEKMTAKYNTLKKLRLPMESRGIDVALKMLKEGTSRGDYEMYVRKNRDRFLDLIFEEGFEKELFTQDLSVQEMEELINYVFEKNYISLSPVGNREHALRSFAMLYMEEYDRRYLQDREYMSEWVEDLVLALKDKM